MNYHAVSIEDANASRTNTSIITNERNDTQFRRTSIHYASSHALSEDYTRYFHGPRDLDRHSKYPMFLRLHGSVMPRMIFPLLCISCWTTLITYISVNYIPLTAEPLLLTVLGLVVGLCLSFRSSTAYERYSEGRKAWATLLVQSRTLARLIWIHIPEQPNTESEPERSKHELLTKISAINLILAFAIALKHKLRFEPYADYDDLIPLIGHLDVYVKDTYDSGYKDGIPDKKPIWKKIGEFLSLSCAISNPRKAMNRADGPLGNLPLEILNYLGTYAQEAATVSPGPTVVSNATFTQLLVSLAALTDVQAQTERVLNTPLPLGYKILTSQLVLLYTYLLPFQLLDKLGWITIPATIAASYIIIGIAAIGNELENPFGDDVNDLPLDTYCNELRHDLDSLTGKKPVSFRQLVCAQENMPLWPLSVKELSVWHLHDEKDIRDVLRAKAFQRKPDPSISGHV